MQLSDITLSELATFISKGAVILGVVSPIIIAVILIASGVKCLLRSEMLRIYYHNEEKETIRQYEYENFVTLHKAYKALRGNSFIDEIYEKIKTWEIVT